LSTLVLARVLHRYNANELENGCSPFDFAVHPFVLSPSTLPFVVSVTL
jgi:hypothetical protein